MADNVTISAMSGGDTIAADDIAGIKFQRMKVCHGADGVATDASATDPLPVTTAPAGTVATGATTVTTAGTAVQLPAGAALSVTVRALSTNAGTIYIGPVGVTTATGFPLSAGDALSMDIANLNLLYANADVSGDKVRYLRVAP